MLQYKQNKLFYCTQKALYEELGGIRRETSDPPQADDARKFCSEIWINLFSIGKVFNVWLTLKRTGSRKDSKQRNNNPGGSNKTSLQKA